MVMAHPLGSDTSSQVQGYIAVKKVGVLDFLLAHSGPQLGAEQRRHGGPEHLVAIKARLLFKQERHQQIETDDPEQQPKAAAHFLPAGSHL